MRLLKLNYMARFIKIIFLMLIVALSVVGCKNEEKEDVEGNRTALVGKWISEGESDETGEEYTLIFEFFKDGEGLRTDIGNGGKEYESFLWTANDDILTIEWLDTDETVEFRYRIKGDKLILNDIENDETLVFKRKS